MGLVKAPKGFIDLRPTIIAALLALSPFAANAQVVVDVNGTSWEINTNDEGSDWAGANWTLLNQQPWSGDASLALVFATKTSDSLGYPNDAYFGPYFVHQTDPACQVAGNGEPCFAACVWENDAETCGLHNFGGGSDPIFAIATEVSVVEPVAIDIKPGSDPNCFNANGHGVIPVAVLGSASFDVSAIDQTTLSFGGATVRVRGNKGPFCGVEDTNGDGWMDIVCQFEDNPDYWETGQDEATLTGKTLDAMDIEGTDSICIVP